MFLVGGISGRENVLSRDPNLMAESITRAKYLRVRYSIAEGATEPFHRQASGGYLCPGSFQLLLPKGCECKEKGVNVTVPKSIPLPHRYHGAAGRKMRLAPLYNVHC